MNVNSQQDSMTIYNKIWTKSDQHQVPHFYSVYYYSYKIMLYSMLSSKNITLLSSSLMLESLISIILSKIHDISYKVLPNSYSQISHSTNSPVTISAIPLFLALLINSVLFYQLLNHLNNTIFLFENNQVYNSSNHSISLLIYIPFSHEIS